MITSSDIDHIDFERCTAYWYDVTADPHPETGEPMEPYQIRAQSNEIIPMQYTGLTDGSGREIYEGDWFRPDIPNCRTALLVERDEHKASYKPFNDPNYNYSSSAGVVIGNKFENPELLNESGT